MISYIAAAVAVLLAAAVLLKDRRAVANWSFAAGLLLLALMELFPGIKAIFFAVAPGAFLVFSLCFARAEYRKYVARWKYVIIAAFVAPLAALLIEKETGRTFYALILMIAVLILANLERTLRGSTGYIRWQIKFVVLGMACICASWVYISSQVLIYSELVPSIEFVHPVMLIVGGMLLAWGLLRSQYLNVDVYLSRTTIHYSLTALLASAYLIVVGLLAYFVRYYNPERLLPLDALIVLLALAGLGILLLSDRIHERLKRFITRHFRRPLYDYRKAWMDLTEKTNALIGIEELCKAVAAIISQTFGILSVNIWLCDENKERLSLAGSTVFTGAQAVDLERGGEAASKLLQTLEGCSSAIDLRENMFDWADDIMKARPEYFAEYKMRYVLPLKTGGLLVGMITLNDDRVGKAPLSLEDQDLLNAYAAQLAARVLQLRLVENLRKAQEIEAFQHVSTFFVHDLKNLASRLSLTMQNLPAHFENPAFRDDALRLVKESVAKIDETIGRLSSLKQVQIKPEGADLSKVLETAISDFESATSFTVEKDYRPLPEVSIDVEQMQKVITNLIMNAYEATRGKGSIRVATSVGDHQVMLCISDNGCGMSRQFMNKMLFRPFSSTKKRGMGIGLFQSKMIVEAHHGKIEVESEEGKGTTFRVILPS
ncbi:MAG: PEP-CTERM system histidine kinase PrsK [Acidobacteria bacterium]|nr:PEP-CTERM system histidine kinase PrsK [Acidobacteriota bacterium]